MFIQNCYKDYPYNHKHTKVTVFIQNLDSTYAQITDVIKLEHLPIASIMELMSRLWRCWDLKTHGSSKAFGSCITDPVILQSCDKGVSINEHSISQACLYLLTTESKILLSGWGTGKLKATYFGNL